MTKNWQIAEKKSDDLFEQILENRGIKNRERFLNPNYDRDISDPLEMKGMKKTVARFEKAIKNKEKIAIFADYDADGIPAAAILFETMKFLKCDLPLVIIPDREDGYGLKEKHLPKIIRAKTNLLITIDCGITNINEINELRKNNIETIIIDHHLPKEKLPKAAAIIDPFPPHFSAAGLVWKFCSALMEKILRQAQDKKIARNFLKWLLDLAAISTICDIVPLTDENRVLAFYGLKVLRRNRRLGLKKLLKVAAIEPEKITPYIVGFQIGPRINAAGRMAGPMEAFDLLVSDNPEQAQELAEKLNEINLERQKKLDEILKQAEEKISKNKLDTKKIILLADENWPVGLVGLLASKIQEKYFRPTFILSKKGESAKGSIRSQDGFHVVEALEKIENYLISFGGHAKAGGLEIENEKIEKFYGALLNIADKILTEKNLQPILKIDATVEKISELNIKLCEEINKMEPFDYANPKPILLLKNVQVKYADKVGQNKNHLKLTLEKDDGIIKAIFFNDNSDLRSGDKIDVVFNLSLNEFNGTKKVELNIIDFKKS